MNFSEFEQELLILEQAVVERTTRDPRLRSSYQRTRAAFAVAEAIGDLIDIAQRSDAIALLDEISARDKSDLEHALIASSESYPTVEFLSRISAVFGYRFELQFIPAVERLNKIKTKYPGEDEITAVAAGGTMVRFPVHFNGRETRSAARAAIKRLLDQRARNDDLSYADYMRLFRALSFLGNSGALRLWEMVEFADATKTKLQLRFSRSKHSPPLSKNYGAAVQEEFFADNIQAFVA